MIITPWNERALWRDVFPAFRRMQDLLTDGRGGFRSGYPALNVWTSDENAVITAELPGADPAKLDISVVGETLTIKGERIGIEPREDEALNRQERPVGSFARSVELPFRAESEKVEATYKNGTLTIRLPRAEQDKLRKINVQAA